MSELKEVMKLNFSKDEIITAQTAKGAIPVANELRADWLALHAEVEAQTTLIEQLEKALIATKSWLPNGAPDQTALSALSAVSAWRKEQK